MTQSAEPWYVAEGKRGQRLLEQGHVGRATDVFKAILARLGEAPSYGRAVILGRLGRCFHMSGQADLAVAHLREAMGVAGRLAPSDGVKGLRGTLRSELGDALRASGQYGKAKQAYEAALKIAEELKDRRAQGVDLGRLGAVALAEGNLEEALVRHRAALLLFQELRESAMEAVAWHQLGRILHEQRQWDEAERHYREAARISEQCGDLAGVAHSRTSLADMLQNQPGRLAEARQLAEDALALAQSHDPGGRGPDIWKTYGILAKISDKEAATTADGERRAALHAQARDYRELERHAPLILATLARLGEAPTCGRAVILGRLGRCFRMGGRPDLALVHLREALGVTASLPPGEGLRGLQGMLYTELGDVLRASGRYDDATGAYHVAARIDEEDGTADNSAAFPSAFEVTLYDELTTDYVFDTDLLVDGPRERRITPWTREPNPLDGDVRPMLVPCARAYMDDREAVRFCLPLGESVLERHPGCVVMRRARREVALSGSSGVVWRLIERMDGAASVAEMLSQLPQGDRATGARMLATLAATGAIDVSGRPIGRFLHSATKKGVLPGGGLESDAVLRLATDGSYRAHPGAPRIALGQSVPERLRVFHALTRTRRSHRQYQGLPLARNDFDALLYTACGVTGAMQWAGREVKLRAYPSSGALYAVEIYPVVFQVEGLDRAVYHYCAVENALEVVRPGIDPACFVAAALPVEREMVAGAAALFCLVGFFPRHERKYGEGGYRMMVAEAGHISQNLILAATASGLSARPFGGVFDDLVNHDLGLDAAEEQFLLAVLVGHAAPTQGA